MIILMKPLKIQPNQFILIGLLVVASVLRFWKFYDLPLMHDELSALTRLEYNSFSEFIHYGIRLDGHPAGIQMFIYFFTSVFGYSTLLLKIPFILVGIWSVYLVYVVGKKWFSETAGLIAASFFIAIQYAIMYSVIIRPYGPGLLVCLLLVNTWTDIFIQKKQNWGKYIRFGLLLACAAYIHYFALLFAAIISLSGLFFLNMKTILKYSISGLLAIVLFIPHLGIFFYQLGVGGIGASSGGWLQEPTIEFIPNYLSYIFNYSNLTLFIAIGLLSFSLFSSFKLRRNGTKKIILLLWFVLPIIIGYWYSVMVNPVLQYSVLLFSTPFVFLLIAGFEKEWKFKWNLLIVSVIGTLSVISLQTKRKHFTSFFNQPVNTYYDLIQEYANDSTLLVGSHEEVFIHHYDRLNGALNNYYTTDEDCVTVAEFQSLLKNPKYSNVIVGSMYLKEFGLATSYFPEVIHYEEGVTLENAVLTKSDRQEASMYYSKVTFGTEEWGNENKKIKQEKNGFLMEGKWGVKNGFRLDSLMNNPSDIIEFYGSFDVQSNDTANVLLVLEFYENGEKVKWTGSSSQDMANLSDTSFHVVNAQQFMEEELIQPDSVVAYVANNKKSKLLIKELQIRIRKGNPDKYALYNRFKD